MGIIADSLSEAGWSWCCGSGSDSRGRTIWMADAYRGDGKRYVVRADEKLTAFLELEAAIGQLRVKTNVADSHQRRSQGLDDIVNEIHQNWNDDQGYHSYQSIPFYPCGLKVR